MTLRLLASCMLMETVRKRPHDEEEILAVKKRAISENANDLQTNMNGTEVLDIEDEKLEVSSGCYEAILALRSKLC